MIPLDPDGWNANTCIMASIFKQSHATPRQASRKRARVDRLLDPGFFKAIGEPTRARLLACLIKCGRPCSVTEVAECCSTDFSMVARHLAALASAGVLDARKQGRTVWYSADAEALSARLRDLADAIDEWNGEPRADDKPGKSGTGCCGGGC